MQTQSFAKSGFEVERSTAGDQQQEINSKGSTQKIDSKNPQDDASANNTGTISRRVNRKTGSLSRQSMKHSEPDPSASESSNPMSKRHD